MHVVVTRDATKFSERAGRFLQARIERNILSTVLADVLGGLHGEPAPLFAYATGAREQVVAAALRTPPRVMLASDIDRHGADALLEVWLEQDPELPGVAGTREATRAIAGAWSERTGGTSRASMRMALHDLTEVRDPPAPASGRLREPGADERSLVIGWFEDFARDAGAQFMPEESMVDARLADGLIFVWDDGAPVCMVGQNHPSAGVVRIGPVFTPPERRRRGYAGSAVAAASRLALARGARTCILYTDLLNPTSNKIYAEVGYRRVADWEELAFEHAQARVRDNQARNGAPTPPI
jgi:predicted GNAT family acetyltransferase